jgi:hypothetical protein
MRFQPCHKEVEPPGLKAVNDSSDFTPPAVFAVILSQAFVQLCTAFDCDKIKVDTRNPTLLY